MVRIVKTYKRLPRDIVDASAQKIFKNRLEKHLSEIT